MKKSLIVSIAALVLASGNVWADSSELVIEGNGACVTGVDGAFEESLTSVVEERMDGGFVATGAGCLLVDILDAWDVTHTQPFIHWNTVDKASDLIPQEVPAGFSHNYLVNYTTTRSFITVHWVMAWLHRVAIGDMEAPEAIVIDYEKISGTPFLPYWKGNIQLKSVAPGVTAFAMVNGFQGRNISSAAVQQSILDVFVKLGAE